MGVLDLQSARARRTARRAAVAEFINTGVAAFGLLEQGARALIPMTAAAAASLCEIRKAATRLDRPHAFDAVNQAARAAAAALRELSDLAKAFEGD